jgi:hypothetical protein
MREQNRDESLGIQIHLDFTSVLSTSSDNLDPHLYAK